MGAIDIQVGGDHYKETIIQPIELCETLQLGPCQSAVVKYVFRWRNKNGVEDLRKAVHYIDLRTDLAAQGMYGGLTRGNQYERLVTYFCRQLPETEAQIVQYICGTHGHHETALEDMSNARQLLEDMVEREIAA